MGKLSRGRLKRSAADGQGATSESDKRRRESLPTIGRTGGILAGRGEPLVRIQFRKISGE